MKLRLCTAVVCTAFSFLAIYAAFRMDAPLWQAAWLAYAVILGFWVRQGRAPRWLMAGGTTLGIASVLTSPYLVALWWAAPAVLLMLHVARCSFARPRSPA